MLAEKKSQSPRRRLEELQARLAEIQNLRKLAIEKKDRLVAQSQGREGTGEGSEASRNRLVERDGGAGGAMDALSVDIRMTGNDCDAHLEWLSCQAKEIWEEIQELDAELITSQLDQMDVEDGSEE